MDVIKTKVMELTENQNPILVAIKFLDERLKEFTEKLTDIEPTGFKDILESLSIIVKNSDDICVMKHTSNIVIVILIIDMLDITDITASS